MCLGYAQRLITNWKVTQFKHYILCHQESRIPVKHNNVPDIYYVFYLRLKAEKHPSQKNAKQEVCTKRRLYAQCETKSQHWPLSIVQVLGVWARCGCGGFRNHVPHRYSSTTICHPPPSKAPSSLTLTGCPAPLWAGPEGHNGGRILKGQYISWTLIGWLTFTMLPSGMGQRTSEGERRREIRLWAIRLMKEGNRVKG